MLQIVEGNEIIEIQSYMRAVKRALVLLCALFPMLAPYELIIKPNWQSYLNIFLLADYED